MQFPSPSAKLGIAVAGRVMRGEGILDQVSPYRDVSSMSRCGLGDDPSCCHFRAPPPPPLPLPTLISRHLNPTQSPVPSTFPFSQTWYAVLDNSVNYCNLHNLVSALGDHRIVRHNLLLECLVFGCWKVFVGLFSRLFYYRKPQGLLHNGLQRLLLYEAKHTAPAH